MNDWAKWLIVLFGIVVFGLVGLTALDKYDERSCRENPAVVQTQESHTERDPATGGFVEVVDRPLILEKCDGFLPW